MHVPVFNYNTADWNDFKALIDFNRDILTFNNIHIIIEHFNDSYKSRGTIHFKKGRRILSKISSLVERRN